MLQFRPSLAKSLLFWIPFLPPVFVLIKYSMGESWHLACVISEVCATYFPHIGSRANTCSL